MWTAYSFRDNFSPLIPLSDWLIFCYKNLILFQKRGENDKKQSFDEKQQ